MLPKPIQLIVDFREKPSGIEGHINKSVFLFKYEFKSLNLGDYVLENCFIIERKTTNDFINSIKTGRLFNQAYRLAKSNLVPMIIIEGDRSVFTKSNISINAIQGALIHLKLFVGIPIFYSESQTKTIELFHQISSQFAKNTQPRKTKKVTKKTNKHGVYKEKQKVLFLENLPGIGYQRAFSLLKTFGTIESVMKASIEELAKIQGIGKITAKRIYEFIHSTYKQENPESIYNMHHKRQKFVKDDNVYLL